MTARMKPAPLAMPQAASEGAEINRFRARHLGLAQREVEGPEGAVRVTVNETESPLAWLARRKGRDGRALIEPLQFAAGERLRAEFTRAQLMPRVTSNWSAPVSDGQHGAGMAGFTDTAIAARQRVRHALETVGPEFSGLLVDVCCFLKGLADVERDRGWPARSGKVVLQLGLDRLARHYGLNAVARGGAYAQLQTWLADDAAFVVEQYADSRVSDAVERDSDAPQIRDPG